MPEALEIITLCDSLNQILKDKVVQKVRITQMRCTNVSPATFQKRTKKAVIVRVYAKGKWIVISLSNGENILISLGVGGEIRYFQNLKDGLNNDQVKVIFKDYSGLSIKFRWFGRFYLATDRELIDNTYTGKKGFSRLDIQTSYLSFRYYLLVNQSYKMRQKEPYIDE